MTVRDETKRRLLERMNFKSEFDELLGSGKGYARHCFNKDAHANGDKTPSLSFDPKTGAWKCHSCGERGDIFSIYMKITGDSFSTVYRRLLEKYGEWTKIPDFDKAKRYESNRKPYKAITDPSVKGLILEGQEGWTKGKGAQHLEFMLKRYGLTKETLQRWKVGYIAKKRRVVIPIWAVDSKVTSKISAYRLPSIVNIRYHDCFRGLCSWYNTETQEVVRRTEETGLDWVKIALQQTDPWEPMWGETTGKVINHKGHGACYLYPLEILQESPMVYVVGGELKALLLNQLGVPAVSFTGGEGSYSQEFIPYFIGKRVRVLFDADPEKPRDQHGLSAIDNKATQLAQAIANGGAEYVEVGRWPEYVRQALPKGGDVTDLMRESEWDPIGLSVIEWVHVERELDDAEPGYHSDLPPDVAANIEVEAVPPLSEMQEVPFTQLINPENLGRYVSFRGQVAGRAEAPFVIPAGAKVVCRTGEAQQMKKCLGCSLPRCGFRTAIKITTADQLKMVGLPLDKSERMLHSMLGITKGCQDAEIEIIPASAEKVTFVPTIENVEQSGEDDIDNPLAAGTGWGHRKTYVLDIGLNRIANNEPYLVGGKILADPVSGAFTMGVTEWARLSDDIFTWKRSSSKNVALRECTSGTQGEGASVRDSMAFMTGQVRDYMVSGIYGADAMLQTIWLSWFMPFGFRLGQQRNERICPSVMILGDTNTGKSTSFKRMVGFYNAGRMVSGEADPTFAGMIGGNASSGKINEFTWGVLPTSHKALVGIDEYNKLDVETIGKMTGTLSSGVAERRTVTGSHRAPCWVRLVYLCNPRGTRRLTSYHNPLDAALSVAGTAQDLGRIDLVHIQMPVNDMSVFTQWHEPAFEQRYTQELGRYHLQWAWSRSPSDIMFENPRGIYEMGMSLADKFGHHVLLLPAQARFKLARIAAAVAMATFSHGKGDISKVLVTDDHVEWAWHFIASKYDAYAATHSDVLPDMPHSLVSFLDENLSSRHFSRLRMLASGARRFSWEDFNEVMGTKTLTDHFLNEIYFKHGMVTKNGGWYLPRDVKKFGDLFEDYMNERERVEAMTGKEAL